MEDGKAAIAADLFTFIDDLRLTGRNKKQAWKAERKAASSITWLG
jgi:hypothetical protein